jgi:hypothetical protein
MYLDSSFKMHFKHSLSLRHGSLEFCLLNNLKGFGVPSDLAKPRWPHFRDLRIPQLLNKKILSKKLLKKRLIIKKFLKKKSLKKRHLKKNLMTWLKLLRLKIL